MLDNFRPYTDRANLTALRQLSSEIIQDVAPDEELSAARLTDRILKGYEDGEILTADTSLKDPGSFGSVDLITLVVVPLLVATLSELFKQLVIWSIEELKKEIDTGKISKKKISNMIDVIVDEKYEQTSKKVKSKKTQTKGKKIPNAVKIRVKSYLEIDS